MSSGGHGGIDVAKDLRWLILILGLLWVMWFFTGGPSRSKDAKPFLTPLAPLGSGQTYGPNDPRVNTDIFVSPK